MSNFAISISDADRDGLSVPPPPIAKKDASLVPSCTKNRQYYDDIAAIKQKTTVFISEELDAYEYPGSLRNYRMMIRCLPWRSDINVILCAARHMLLLDEYEVKYLSREGLDTSLENGYWDISYTTARQQFYADADTQMTADVYIPYSLRKRIWIELFSAFGYTVKWGSSVLNVRKKK